LKKKVFETRDFEWLDDFFWTNRWLIKKKKKNN